MESFIVSARKYRPQTFDTVIGQPTITSTLKNAIMNNQVAQAFLFCGPRGVGKTTCARILAKTINCATISPRGEACDQCSSCISFNENASFNIYELDGASNNSVDDIRSLVDQVRIPPQMGKYKVYIIDEVHMLSASAFNAFLKTLEEPPSYAKFILATTEKHKIFPTILSRCQIFDFKRITVEDIARYLKFVAQQEKVESDEDALHIIALKADGAMRDALSIFDQLVSFAGKKIAYETVLTNLNVLDYEYFFRITDEILASSIPNTLITINEILDKGFDGQHFLIGFGEHIRNLLVCKDETTAKLLETAPGIRNHYLEQSRHCSGTFLLKSLEIQGKCDLNYKISNNKRLHIELALMQMCQQEDSVKVETAPVSLPAQKKSPLPESKKTVGTVRMKDIEGSVPRVPSIRNPHENPLMSDSPLHKDENSTLREEPLTLEQLMEVWDRYTEKIKVDYPHLHTILRQQRPELSEDFTIRFAVSNKLLEDELQMKKSDLLDFLRTALSNIHIRLEVRVEDQIREQRPYTDREKFERMAEKNPSLRSLKEQMDLEIGY